jgi:hypothetical protein
LPSELEEVVGSRRPASQGRHRRSLAGRSPILVHRRRCAPVATRQRCRAPRGAATRRAPTGRSLRRSSLDRRAGSAGRPARRTPTASEMPSLSVTALPWAWRELVCRLLCRQSQPLESVTALPWASLLPASPRACPSPGRETALPAAGLALCWWPANPSETPALHSPGATTWEQGSTARLTRLTSCASGGCYVGILHSTCSGPHSPRPAYFVRRCQRVFLSRLRCLCLDIFFLRHFFALVPIDFSSPLWGQTYPGRPGIFPGRLPGHTRSPLYHMCSRAQDPLLDFAKELHEPLPVLGQGLQKRDAL